MLRPLLLAALISVCTQTAYAPEKGQSFFDLVSGAYIFACPISDPANRPCFLVHDPETRTERWICIRNTPCDSMTNCPYSS